MEQLSYHQGAFNIDAPVFISYGARSKIQIGCSPVYSILYFYECLGGYVHVFEVPYFLARQRYIKNKKFQIKSCGASASTLELFGIFLRFRRTFAEVFTFGKASAHEFQPNF